VQPRPTASELLATVAQVLEEHVVPALSGPAQHQARVAASLVGIVDRELRLSHASDEREREELATLLDAEGTTEELRARFAAALRAGFADDDAVAARVWPILMDGVRADLAVVKPGHDSWDGD
jgi:predicted secreted protein